MKSTIAALRELTLPFGVTSGIRLVLDGVNGVIQGYDENNQLVFELNGTDASWGTLPSGERVEIDGDNGVINIYDDSGNLVAVLSGADGLTITDSMARGITTINPFVETASTPTGSISHSTPTTVHATPSTIPHGTNDLELRFACVSYDEIAPDGAASPTNTFTPPAGYTEREDTWRLTIFGDRASYATFATKELTSDAATGVQNFTSSHNFFGEDRVGFGLTVDFASADGLTASYRSHTWSKPSGPTQVLTLDKPTGTIEGDTLVAFLIDPADETPTPISPPSGWQLLLSDTELYAFVANKYESSGTAKLWYRIAGTSEPADYNFTCHPDGEFGHTIGFMVTVANAAQTVGISFIDTDGIINATLDIQRDFRSLPRGIASNLFDDGTADAARAPGDNTDMGVTVDVDMSRLYRVHIKAQISVGVAAAVYAVNLSEGGTVGANNGTVVDRYFRWPAAHVPAGSTVVFLNGSCVWKPATPGPQVVRFRNDAGSGGTITCQGAAGNRRQMWVEDIGTR